MNAKVLLKVVFLMTMLLLLVIMGMNNRQNIELSLDPVLRRPVKARAALMYFGFFAAGVLSATVIGAGKKGGGAAKSKAKG